MSGKTRSQRCDYSPLEDRRLLAVTSVLDAGVLSIYGDSNANTVTVQQTDSFLDIGGDLTAQYNIADVSQVRFFGAAGDDFFENFTDINTLAVGHAGNDELRTAGGIDRVLGGPGNDLLISTGGDDRLVGHDGIDTIFGGAGDDAIYGLNGNDEIYGEAGDDVLVAGFGDDVVYGGDGEDLVYGHFGADQIFGGADNDRLFGQNDNDFIQGDAGDDTVRGGRGDDTLNGNAGNDRILGDENNDTINGGEGNEIIFAGDGDDFVQGGAGNDLLFAGAGNDEVFGQAGNDVVRGNDGNDTLDGGDNADRVAGDNGDDIVTGGGAIDTVLGGAGADTIIAESSDRAIGGAGDDRLQLSDFDGDTAIYSGNYSNYVVTLASDQLVVRDTTGADGQDIVTGADSLQFADVTRVAEAEITERVYVLPIIASDNDGSNTAVFFGDADNEFDIKRRIDEIYLVAGIDIEWLSEKSTDSTFINFGTGSGTRTQNDLFTIVDDGEASGLGSNDPLVIDMYFVNRVPGFQVLSANSANGLAFVGDSGITMHVGDNLLNSSSGRQVTARVAAHEIAHNLGLVHVNDPTNLMDDGVGLYNSQITTMLNSQFSQLIGGSGDPGDSGDPGSGGSSTGSGTSGGSALI